MAETVCAGIACEGCGYHFPQLAEKGIVPCPHCGRPTHIPGAIVCLECDHLNQDVSYCVSCGAALFRKCPSCGSMMEVDQKACGVCGAVYAKAHKTKARPIIKVLLAFGFIIALLFTCIWSVFLTVPFFGQEGPFVDPQVAQARKEAQQQFEREQNSIPFDGIEISVGEIISREVRGLSEDLYVTYPVVIENRGDEAHTVLLAYRPVKKYYSGRWPDVGYKTLEVPAHSTGEFVVEHWIGSTNPRWNVDTGVRCYKLDRDNSFLLARLESVDEMPRSTTSRDSEKWDYEIEIIDTAPCESYGLTCCRS